MPDAPPAAAQPSGSLLQPSPNNHLAAQHTEDTASAIELCVAQAAHQVTKTTLEAAQLALEAADVAHKAAEARVAKANQRSSANAPLGCNRNPSQYCCPFLPFI
jgi:hypothetical protein